MVVLITAIFVAPGDMAPIVAAIMPIKKYKRIMAY
jgi:hypothetical protein